MRQSGKYYFITRISGFNMRLTSETDADGFSSSFNNSKIVTGKRSASSPGAGAVCNEETKESANEQAFNNFIGWYILHESSFSKIEEAKSNTSTYDDGYDSCLKSGRTYGPFNPVAFRFYFELFELHIYKYVDIKMCKSNLFSCNFTLNPGCLNNTG